MNFGVPVEDLETIILDSGSGVSLLPQKFYKEDRDIGDQHRPQDCQGRRPNVAGSRGTEFEVMDTLELLASFAPASSFLHGWMVSNNFWLTSSGLIQIPFNLVLGSALIQGKVLPAYGLPCNT